MSEKNVKKRKVSQKKRNKARQMWIEQFFLEIDELKERIKDIEDFLGGRKSIREVLENLEELEY